MDSSSNIIDLHAKKAPVVYTIRITHHYNGQLEVAVEDVADEDRSRESVAFAIGQAAIALAAKPIPQADALNKALLERISVLMGAAPDTKEARELSALADAVQAYESARYIRSC